MADQNANVYFDNNSTTPLDPRVRDAMLPALSEHHGNPSSSHRWGRESRQAVETARAQVAALLGAEPSRIVFTSSGTEANNTVIYALGRAAGFRGHVVTTALEHPSVLAAAALLAAAGMEVTELDPDVHGVVDPEAVASALRPDTRLVCLMLANNELGTIQPVRRVAALCRENGVPVLTDAVQAVGKIPVDAGELGVDYLALGGHKFHGPLGAAALWIRDGAYLEPLLTGAPQEGGRRAGTENVPAIAGLGKAAELAAAELNERRASLDALRRRFERGLAAIPETVVHGAGSPRLPHTTNVAFLGVSGHELMHRLDAAGYAVSTGAACHSGRPQASAALLRMGIAEDEALASLRVSFGIFNTADEVDGFLATLAGAVAALREVAVHA
jgi:cysteine desulfurase